MSLELLTAAALLLGLIVYAVTGGADFGGGVWDLFARGPRAQAQRKAIEHALAPVWEANHVWLIFVVVVLFTAFSPAYARLSTDLHIPLTLFLIGIVLRGSAFVFRQYGSPRQAHRWGFVFAISSLVAPLFLGVVLGAVTTGGAWWAPFPLALAALALAAFALLAAVYLTVELRPRLDEPSADRQGLHDDFRRRGVLAAGAVAVTAITTGLLAWRDARPFARDLFGSWWSLPVIGGAVVATVIVVVALRRERDRLARVAAIGLVVLLVLGWAAAHYPLLVAPDLTIAAAASPSATLGALVPIMIGGAVILVPSLWWLMRVFKSGR